RLVACRARASREAAPRTRVQVSEPASNPLKTGCRVRFVPRLIPSLLYADNAPPAAGPFPAVPTNLEPHPRHYARSRRHAVGDRAGDSPRRSGAVALARGALPDCRRAVLRGGRAGAPRAGDRRARRPLPRFPLRAPRDARPDARCVRLFARSPGRRIRVVRAFPEPGGAFSRRAADAGGARAAL